MNRSSLAYYKSSPFLILFASPRSLGWAQWFFVLVWFFVYILSISKSMVISHAKNKLPWLLVFAVVQFACYKPTLISCSSFCNYIVSTGTLSFLPVFCFGKNIYCLSVIWVLIVASVLVSRMDWISESF